MNVVEQIKVALFNCSRRTRCEWYEDNTANVNKGGKHNATAEEIAEAASGLPSDVSWRQAYLAAVEQEADRRIKAGTAGPVTVAWRRREERVPFG